MEGEGERISPEHSRVPHVGSGRVGSGVGTAPAEWVTQLERSPPPTTGPTRLALRAGVPRTTRGVLLGGVDLDLHGRAVITVAGHEDVERTVGQTDDAVHLRPELHVVAGLRHGFVDDPAAACAVMVVVHEEIHRVRYVLGQKAVRGDRLADVLVAAIARPQPVRLV